MAAERTLWMLEAATDVMSDAATEAGLDPNALEVDLAVARITWPSFFCASPHRWMKTLAGLGARGVEFRICLVELDPGEEARERRRVALYPAIDAELRALLREIDACETEWLVTMNEKIEEAMENLRRQSRAPGHIAVE